MFELLLFIAACAAIAFLVANIQKLTATPKTKLQPIKIEREDTLQNRLNQRRRRS
ncbi:hypothetical protein [Marinomonas algarum]|uniref:Uncharacterized protein n=1 Tax=Marinomonas algarum TaxID=2883105 RepID=A0A9X1LF78_9GAMM|nr:hypothetical protein [Marinomonas algarum]MCB5162746.1 hypothetical protein [Marinomonas algarum]